MMNGEGIAGTSSSIVEDDEIQNPEGSRRAQTQDTASTESRLDHIKSKSRSLDKKWQVSIKVCIYRVPKPMRISKPEIYDPLVVSFGPFHYNMNPKMDEHKLEAVHRTSERLRMGVPDLIEYIKTFDARIRECYEEPIQWDGETLSRAFTMDACFILEFLKGPTRTGKQSDPNLFSLVFQDHRQINSISYGIMKDIMKMENQIPLFLLKSLLKEELETEVKAEKELCSMLYASGLFGGFPFRSSFSSSNTLEQQFEKLRNHVNQQPAHLLDLYRIVIEDLLTHSTKSASDAEPDKACCEWLCIDIPDSRSTDSSNDRRESASSDDSRSIPSAELLQTAGIKFEPGQIDFRKRRFGKSTLSLPQIIVEDRTVTLLRNVMAYEECQKCSWNPKKTVISHFFILLDYLIDSAKDVSVLRKAGVISSLACSDEDIACRFNSINEGIIEGTYDGFHGVMKKATKHYESQWNVWISQFQEEHCSKPWYVVSLAAGILVLALTAVQAVYAVRSCQKHNP